MSFRLVGRLPGWRALMPRVTAPLLPTTFKTSNSSLTRTARPVQSRRLFQNFSSRMAETDTQNRETPTLSPDATLSQRLKYLIKSYGWYALGIYLVIGTLDFGVSFAAVNLLGADRVSAVVTSVKSTIYGVINSKPPEPGKDELDNVPPTNHQGLYAMLILAWALHKTVFMPLRVGLTAAFTPRFVKWLRSRGWAGGAGTRRAAEEMKERIRNRRNRD